MVDFLKAGMVDKIQINSTTQFETFFYRLKKDVYPLNLLDYEHKKKELDGYLAVKYFVCR
ncbi:hypothetical protein GW750_05640 [bacterium]|nr:hypothetical protein [bacterium]